MAREEHTQGGADASHELRAPVSLIRTTAELAVNRGRTNAEYREDLLQILAEAERSGGSLIAFCRWPGPMPARTGSNAN